MSHHLDSPIARQDVRLDITDLYVFRGEVGTALVVNVCHSIAGDIPVPGYHPEGMYEFKLDLDGDGVEDITYRVLFGPRRDDGKQHLTVRRITGPSATDPFEPGVPVAQGDTDDEILGENGIRVWAGKAGDPFWIDPNFLHALGHAFQDGARIDPDSWTPAQAKNLFAGHTVYSIVLEVPDGDLLADEQTGRPVGVWAVASLATDAGGWRSINRFGLPMIHPLFTQFNEALGNSLNAGRPADDFATYGELLTREIADVVSAYGTAADAKAYAQSVVHRLLPNVLPYVIGTPAVFGFNGWNGRSLTDDASDVMVTIATNTPIAQGIGKESVTSKPHRSFPYVPSAILKP